jgi:predicted ATP-grasp superfamily ATP-dependent carboligase
VLQETIRLFQGVNYQGLGYVEMKRDQRTGKYYIIEPNIGRPTGRSAIAEAGGVELLYTMYCDAVGLPLPENREQQYKGVKWIYFRRDLQSAWYYWSKGQLSLKGLWQSWRGPKADAVFSWGDMGPFFADFQGKLGLLLKRRRKNDPDWKQPAILVQSSTLKKSE